MVSLLVSFTNGNISHHIAILGDRGNFATLAILNIYSLTLLEVIIWGLNWELNNGFRKNTG